MQWLKLSGVGTQRVAGGRKGSLFVGCEEIDLEDECIEVHKVCYGGRRRRREDLYAHIVHQQHVPHGESGKPLSFSYPGVSQWLKARGKNANPFGLFSFIIMLHYCFFFLNSHVVFWICLFAYNSFPSIFM